MANADSGGKSPVQNLDRVPRDEGGLVALLDDVYRYLRPTRYNLEYSIQETLHFLSGSHWIKYLSNENRFVGHSLEEWKPTPVTNYLVESFDYLLELFLGGDPLPVCDPASRDQDDVQAAAAAQRVLRSEFERMKSDRYLLPRAAGWLVLCGNAVLTSTWNANAGDIMRVPKTHMRKVPREVEAAECLNPQCPMFKQAIDARVAEPQCRVCGQPMTPTTMNERNIYGEELYDSVEEPVRDKNGRPKYDEVTVGNIEEAVLSPLNWFPHPAAKFEESRYVLEMEPKDVDEIKSIFGSKAADIAADNVMVETWSAKIGRLASSINNLDESTSRDQAVVKILRHVPDKRWPKGLFLIGVGDKILFRGDLDSTDGKLGYTHIVYREMPGQFWGRGPLQDLLSPQKRINSIDSHIVQNRKQMINGRWLVPEGAGISRVTGESGAIIRWSPHTTGGYEPKPVMGVPLPAQVIEERHIAQQAMNQIGGIGEIMRGQLPRGGSGLETGAAVEFMYESAYKRFKAPINNWRTALADHEARNLRLAAEKWTEERLVRTLGENGEYESYFYRGADLFGAESMIVRVSVGMQTSRVAYQRRIMEAAGKGLLGDLRRPEVRGRILEAMEIEGFDSEYLPDARKARRVLKDLIDGREPEKLIAEIDNHAVQFSVLKDYILTAEFSALPDDRKQAIVDRARQHRQIMQQQQQRVMQAAQAAKGTGNQVSDAVVASGATGTEPVPTQQ